MAEKRNILLDMDEVLSGFFEHALEVLNKATGKNVTVNDYIDGNTQWEMEKAYGISKDEFWEIIESDLTFWDDLKMLPWAKELYSFLSAFYEVTIVSTPSPTDAYAWGAKKEWLKRNLGIESRDIILCAKKELLAGNGILIDDNPSNIEKFEKAGGKGILVPATWNTKGINNNMFMTAVTKGLKSIAHE